MLSGEERRRRSGQHPELPKLFALETDKALQGTRQDDHPLTDDSSDDEQLDDKLLKPEAELPPATTVPQTFSNPPQSSQAVGCTMRTRSQKK
jgi:hypothetical protein